MLSAVETFGPAAASATNAYAAAAAAAAAAQQNQHHNHISHLSQHHPPHHPLATHHHPFALAAAAAAAAAASVVMPPTQGQNEPNQLTLDHYTIAGHGPLLGHHMQTHPHHHLNHLNHLSHPSGIYLSSIPSVSSSTSSANTTSSMNILHQQSIAPTTGLQSSIVSSGVPYSSSSNGNNLHSTISPCSSPAKSPSLTIRNSKDSTNNLTHNNNNNYNNNNNNLSIDSKLSSSIMSISEFVRPHPKQPRYNNNSTNGSTNNNNNNNNINNSNFNNNIIGSNGIPLLGRKKLSPPSSECLQINESKVSLTKYSNEPPQTGPVNLATNNNNNNVKDYNKGFNKETNNNNRITPLSLTEVDGKKTNNHIESPPSNENLTKDNLCTIPTSLYSQKISQLTPPPSAPLTPYHFSYSPHSLYAPRGTVYGSPALYASQHPALGRNSQVLGRAPTFLPDLPPYSPYLPPSVVYSPPGSASTPKTPIQSSIGGIPVPSLQQQQASPPNLLRPSNSGKLLSENLPNSKSPTQQQQQQPLSISSSQKLASSQSFVPQSSSLPQSNFVTATDQQRALHSHNPQQYHQSNFYHHNHQHDKNANGGLKSFSNNNPKISNQNNSDGGSFKVPSGKEGSLKHRFLTRPKSDRDLKRRSPNSANKNNNNSSITPSNFSKGSYIELGNGSLRRVEDMRTEDFIQSAEKSEHHQLIDSTVVKITNTPNSVIITFSYDKNRSKADVEVSQEYPFFVYGQGWASYNPDLSLQQFGLKCKRLQVGDVCISLIETSSPTTSASSLSTLSSGKNPSSSSCSSTCSLESCVTNSPSASPIIDVTTVTPQNLSISNDATRSKDLNTGIDIKNQGTHYHHNTLPQNLSYDMHNSMQQSHNQHTNNSVISYDMSISRHHANINSSASALQSTPHELYNGGNNSAKNNRDIVNHHQHNLLQHQLLQNSQRINGKPTNLSDSHYLAPPPLSLGLPQQPLTAPSTTKNIEFTFSPPLNQHHHQQQQPQQQQQQPFYLGKPATLPTPCRSASPPRSHREQHHSISNSQQSVEPHDLVCKPENLNSRKRRWSAPEDKCDDENVYSSNGDNSNGERQEKINTNEQNNCNRKDGEN